MDNSFKRSVHVNFLCTKVSQRLFHQPQLMLTFSLALSDSFVPRFGIYSEQIDGRETDKIYGCGLIVGQHFQTVPDFFQTINNSLEPCQIRSL